MCCAWCGRRWRASRAPRRCWRFIDAKPDGAVRPRLRFLSPLAEGADRLAAAAALDEGFALHAAMPFPHAEYKKDFAEDPASLAAFQGLLGRAEPGATELDGSRDDEARSYQAV